MIPVHEAQKRLIQEGFLVDMRSPFKELTILDAKYEDVKSFLKEQGYDGNIVVIGKYRKMTERNAQISTLEHGVDNLSTGAVKSDSGKNHNVNNKDEREIYEQLSLF